MDGESLLRALDFVLNILSYFIVARAIVSWFPVSKDGVIVKFLNQMTEPMLEPIRKMLAKTSLGSNAGIDFSPLVVIMIIMLVRGFLPSSF